MNSAANPNPSVAVIGRGRMGGAIARALGESGFAVEGPLGRGPHALTTDVALLCVPDGEIEAAAAGLVPGPVVGHCSGALGLGPLAPHPGFGLHPLMTIADGDGDLAAFAGAGCAVAGSDGGALQLALMLARSLGMSPFEVADEDRAAYHAAASIASNYLLTVQHAARQLAATAGVPAGALAPLVRATVVNLERLGPEAALTGPVARGDQATVARQRVAVAERSPEHLALFDALTAATRDLAGVAAVAA